MTFSENVGIPGVGWDDYFKITGVDPSMYTDGVVTYGQVMVNGVGVWTATWSLPGSGVFTADKLMVNISGDIVSVASGIKLAGAWTNPTPPAGGSVMPSGGEAKTPGTPFNFRVNMLPGSVTGGEKVLPADVLAVRQGLNAPAGNPQYSVFRDLSGAGIVRQADFLAVRQRLNSELPDGEPQPYAFEPALNGESMTMTSAGSTDGSTSLSDAQRLAWVALGSDFADDDGSTKKKTT